MRLTRDVLERAARERGGVLTRAQLLALGADDAWVERRVLSGAWQRVLSGIVVPWSGPIPWEARAWAAVLGAGEGAVLSHHSAAYLHGLVEQPPSVLDVTLPHGRRAGYASDVRIHRRRHPSPSSGRPPRTWLADTVVDLVASSESDGEAVGWVTAAARKGMNERELARAIERRARFRRRPLLLDLVAEVADGVESPLELRYRRDVERRHGLPAARLQVRDEVGGLSIRADGIYDGLGVRVELDGRLGHPGGRTDADTWRDNAVLLERHEITLRYRWVHVTAQACGTAAQVAAALARGGWSGHLRRCGPGCRVGA